MKVSIVIRCEGEKTEVVKVFASERKAQEIANRYNRKYGSLNGETSHHKITFKVEDLRHVTQPINRELFKELSSSLKQIRKAPAALLIKKLMKF